MQCYQPLFSNFTHKHYFYCYEAPHFSDIRNFVTVLYIEYILIYPSPYRTISPRKHCKAARSTITELLHRFGLRRHPTKGEWEEATVVEHLSFVVHSQQMKFFVPPRKLAKVRGLASRLLRKVNVRQRWVSRRSFRSFWSLRVSYASDAMGTILHSPTLLGYVAQCLNRWKKQMHAQTPRNARL